MSYVRGRTGVESGIGLAKLLTGALAMLAVSVAVIVVPASAQAAPPGIFSDKTIVQPGPVNETLQQEVKQLRVRAKRAVKSSQRICKRAQRARSRAAKRKLRNRCMASKMQVRKARTMLRTLLKRKQGSDGIEYRHRDWRVSHGGTGYDAWYTFEPTKPRPKRAPVAVVTHGYFEYSGYDRLFELIRHTVLSGNVVVFPRWQTDETVPCPGPLDISPCMDSAVKGILDGLEHLRNGENRVKPDLSKTSYYGYSFGGIITANIADRYQDFGLPRPRAIFLDDPHDGELAGPGEPALSDSLAGIPADVKFECHSGADGVIGAPGLQDGSCNAVFPKLDHIPKQNKALVMTHTDSWGTPTLSSVHGVCAGEEGTANAYDWRFCWRDWDALRTCAIHEKRCHLALGTGPKHTWLGRWSDGRPVTRLTVQKEAPLIP